jgi:hypothetical protein
VVAVVVVVVDALLASLSFETTLEMAQIATEQIAALLGTSGKTGILDFGIAFVPRPIEHQMRLMMVQTFVVSLSMFTLEFFQIT